MEFCDGLVDAIVRPSDYIVGDLNGVVCIPRSLVAQVLEILPKIVKADELVAADIDSGAGFVEATRRHRD